MDVVRRQLLMGIDVMVPVVSILVLMDVVRRLYVMRTEEYFFSSLNPCFNGCSTPTSAMLRQHQVQGRSQSLF